MYLCVYCVFLYRFPCFDVRVRTSACIAGLLARVHAWVCFDLGVGVRTPLQGENVWLTLEGLLAPESRSTFVPVGTSFPVIGIGRADSGIEAAYRASLLSTTAIVDYKGYVHGAVRVFLLSQGRC